MWDHSKISSGRFVAGVNETKSKIFLFKNIRCFRDICHKLFLNNACFAADVVGFMIHILGLRIFPKSFGFFPGCSQQDLLEIICGRSLLRKATEICFRISLKNCLWIFPIRVIVSYSLRNYEVTPGVCPRPIPQEICLANLSILSLQKPWGGICHEKTISSNLAKISRPKTKICWGISPKTPLLF